MTPFALKGTIIWAPARGEISIRPHAYAVCGEDGLCAGVFDALPPAFAALPVRELGEAIIIPEEWDAVQDELARRKQIGSAYSGKRATIKKYIKT